MDDVRSRVSIFEFVFSLYSLLFGLALAQVFAGLGNTLQERHKVKIGWLTPLLGLFVTIDITSFWAIGWEMRGMLRPDFLYLLCGVLLAGIYYLAALLVFPKNFAEARLKSIEQLVRESGVRTAAEIEAAGTSLAAEPIARRDEF